MKKTSRILSILLAVMLLLALFTGCGSGSSSPAEEDTSPAAEEPAAEPAAEEPTAEQPAAEPAAEEPAAEPAAEEPADNAGESGGPVVSLPITEEHTTFTVFSALDGALGQVLDENEYANLLYYRELEARTNIELEMTLVGIQNFADVLAVSLAGGEYTDIMLLPGESYIGSLESAVDEEIAVDLSGFIEENMPFYMQILDEHPDYRKAVTSADGRYLAIYGFYADDYPPSQGPAIRTDYMEAVGETELPVTYDDYYELLKKFKVELDLTAPLFITQVCDMNGGAWAGGYGVLGTVGSAIAPPFYQVDGEVHYGPAEEGFKDYLTMMRQWYEEGIVYPDFATNTDGMVPAMDIPDQWGVANMVGDFLEAYGFMFAGNPQAKFSATNIPVLKEGDTAHFRENVSQIQTTITVITTECADPELACRYFDYYFSPEGFILLNYGLEGESFEYVDGEPMLLQSIFDDNPDLSEQVVTKLYGLSTGSFVRDWKKEANRFSEIRNQAKEIWSKSDNAYNIPSAVVLSADENSVYSNLYPSIDTYIAETVPLFIMGDKPMEEFDGFVDQLIDLGIQDCIDMKQAALDRYNDK